jgi:hypothetical protein
MLASKKVVEVLLVINGGNCLAQTSWLASSLGALDLEGTDNQPVSEQELFVESG